MIQSIIRKPIPMNKKKILLLTSIASIATFSAAAILFSSHSTQGIKAEPDLNSYVLDFTNAHCHVDSSDVYGYYFTLSMENGIGGKYDFSSSSNTYIYVDDLNSVDFSSNDNIFEIENGTEIGLAIDFDFIGRATVDEENSYVVLTIDDNTFSDTFYPLPEDREDWGDPYNFYYYLYRYSCESFILESVHIEFTCDK